MAAEPISRIVGYCPQCGSTDITRSHRRSGLERLASFFLRLWPVRCTTCNWRGYVFSCRDPKNRVA